MTVQSTSPGTARPRQHDLKTWPEFFADILSGQKPFEIRNNDRDFCVGDKLLLREYDPKTDQFSGRSAVRRVSYILGHRPEAGCAATFGLQPGYVIMGIVCLAQTSSVRAACDACPDPELCAKSSCLIVTTSPVAGEEIKRALVTAKCTSPDGTFVHASMDDVLRALSLPSTNRDPPLCSCKASARDGRHMAWCAAMSPAQGKAGAQ